MSLQYYDYFFLSININISYKIKLTKCVAFLPTTGEQIRLYYVNLNIIQPYWF